MDFYIKKNATLPVLKMELIDDGRNDYNKFHDKVQNATITFSMTEIENGVKRIGNKTATLFLKEPLSTCNGEEYFIGYKFSSKETKKSGTYIGEFKIVFNDGSGTLLVPIKEDLFIHILGD